MRDCAALVIFYIPAAVVLGAFCHLSFAIMKAGDFISGMTVGADMERDFDEMMERRKARRVNSKKGE